MKLVVTTPPMDGIKAMLITDIDARVYGGMMVVCEFSGKEFSPDGQRRCKLYEKATHHNRCMYFRKNINGTCDNSKPK